MKTYKKPKWISENYGISPSSLRSWANAGTIDHFTTPGGSRLYNIDSLTKKLGIRECTNINGSRKKYIYGRASSAKQREDLRRQVTELQEAYPEHGVITDIGSGINFKRPGLRTLLDKLDKGMVSEVVVMHRDRLARFACDLLEFFFQQKGCKFVVHRRGEGPEEFTQLAEDLMAITTVFVASHHGKRAAENRRKRKERTGEEKKETCKVKSKKSLQISEDSKSEGVSNSIGTENY